MRVVVLKEKITPALSQLVSVAGNNKTLAVLSNIKLEATDSQLRLSATDLEIAAVATVGCRVDEPGSTTLPARLLSDYIQAVPLDRIEIVTDGHNATISAGGYSSTINGMAADDFPDLPVSGGGSSLELPADEALLAIDKTMFSVSTDTSRPALGGVYLDVVDGCLAWVSTDSYRLSVLKTQTKASIDPFILPRASAAALARAIGKTGAKVTLRPSEDQVGIETQDMQIISRLIDASYPNYGQIIPKESDCKVTASRKELISATKIAGLFSRESAGSINVSASESSGEMRIESSAGQVGRNSSGIKASVTGEAEVALNSRYLLDGLNSFDDDEVEIWLTGKISPCLIKSPKNDDYIHLVMPLRS